MPSNCVRLYLERVSNDFSVAASFSLCAAVRASNECVYSAALSGSSPNPICSAVCGFSQDPLVVSLEESLLSSESFNLPASFKASITERAWSFVKPSFSHKDSTAFSASPNSVSHLPSLKSIPSNCSEVYFPRVSTKEVTSVFCSSYALLIPSRAVVTEAESVMIPSINEDTSVPKRASTVVPAEAASSSCLAFN